jgi:hypothetical protein
MTAREKLLLLKRSVKSVQSVAALGFDHAKKKETRAE